MLSVSVSINLTVFLLGLLLLTYYVLVCRTSSAF